MKSIANLKMNNIYILISILLSCDAKIHYWISNDFSILF